MQPFIGTLTGTIMTEGDAADLGLTDNISPSELFDAGVDVDIYDVTARGTVTLEARAVIDGFEVDVADYEGFDPDIALAERVGSYGSAEAEGTEFEVTSGPAGFEEVSAVVGMSTAIDVYVALASAGFDVI